MRKLLANPLHFSIKFFTVGAVCWPSSAGKKHFCSKLVYSCYHLCNGCSLAKLSNFRLLLCCLALPPALQGAASYCRCNCITTEPPGKDMTEPPGDTFEKTLGMTLRFVSRCFHVHVCQSSLPGSLLNYADLQRENPDE